MSHFFLFFYLVHGMRFGTQPKPKPLGLKKDWNFFYSKMRIFKTWFVVTDGRIPLKP